jgi:hypothetical protein
MTTTELSSEAAAESPRARTVDMKLEVVVIPVSGVDRAKRFLRRPRLEARCRFREG